MDETFQVSQYPTNERWEAICEAIKETEPALRVQGRAIDWDEFNRLFDQGAFANPEEAVRSMTR